VKDALMRAIHVDPVEGRKRMNAMHTYIRAHDVRTWADSFLTALGTTD
jgi:trehalose 6-phosphate synthase